MFLTMLEMLNDTCRWNVFEKMCFSYVRFGKREHQANVFKINKTERTLQTKKIEENSKLKLPTPFEYHRWTDVDRIKNIGVFWKVINYKILNNLLAVGLSLVHYTVIR